MSQNQNGCVRAWSPDWPVGARSKWGERGSTICSPGKTITACGMICPVCILIFLKTKHNTADTYFTILEVAGLLKVSKDTIQRAIKARHLSAIKVGAQWRISETQIQEYLAHRTLKAKKHWYSFFLLFSRNALYLKCRVHPFVMSKLYFYRGQEPTNSWRSERFRNAFFPSCFGKRLTLQRIFILNLSNFTTCRVVKEIS